MPQRAALQRLQYVVIAASLWPSQSYALSQGTLERSLFAVYVFTLMFCLGMAGSYFYFRYRDAKQMAERAKEGKTIYLRPTRESVRPSGRTPLGMEAILVDDFTSSPIAQLLAGAASGDQECPSCGRHFDETLSVCPFDATPLKSKEARRQVARRTPDPKPTCPSCGRQYESGADFCREDGAGLTMKSSGESVPVVHVCVSCGDESTDEVVCCENPEHKEIDPSNSKVQAPPFPMSICPACHVIAGPGQTHCKHDDEILRPMNNIHITVLSVTGMGPRRKICEACGTRYSLAASRCAKDGEALVDLN